MPGDDDLPAVRVGVEAEGRIFVREGAQGVHQLHFFGPVLGLHRDRDHRLREVDGFQQNRGPRSHRVSPVVVRSRPTDGDDIARVGLLQLLPPVGVHAQDAARPLRSPAWWS